MLQGNQLVGWEWLVHMGWQNTQYGTSRLIARDRFPRPFRRETDLSVAQWRVREVLPFVRRRYYSQR